MLAAVAPRRPRAGCPSCASWSTGAARADRRARARRRCPTSRRPRAACATRPCSRRWSRPGWSTCRTSTWSAAGWRCSTSATLLHGRRRPGHRPGRAGAVARPRRARSGCADARGRPAARPRARPPDHPPVPADLAPGRRRAGPAGGASGARRPALDAGRAAGSRVSRGEVVLDRGARPGRRPAAAAARGRRGRRARRSCWRPPTAARLVRECAAAAGAVAGRGPRRCWSGCSPPGRGLLAGLGDPRRDRRAGADPARVGADPAAAARLGRSTGSPSTGTSSRPASRRPR